MLLEVDQDFSRTWLDEGANELIVGATTARMRDNRGNLIILFITIGQELCGK